MSPRAAYLPSLLRIVLLGVLVAIVGAPTISEAAPPVKPAPLAGKSVDYAYDGKDVGDPSRAWLGRAYVHPEIAAAPKAPRPLLVFLHGLNTELIKYRWMGGGNEGDVRRFVDELVDADAVEPFILAAPSSVVPSAVGVARTSWPEFDLDGFVQRTEAALAGTATIDRSRIVVAGHSGGGCNDRGGLGRVAQSKLSVHAALAIDVCMDPSFATALAKVRPTTHVVVAYQLLTWSKRPVSAFVRRFQSEVAKAPPSTGVLREIVEERPREPMPHDAMVGLTLRRWLPKLLPPNVCAAPIAGCGTSGTSVPPTATASH